MLLRISLILCLLLCPLSAVAGDWNRVGPSGGPVHLEADQLSYDRDTGRYRASGNVQLKQGDLELHSQTLWWNQTSGEVDAEGDVQLTAPEETMTGSRVHYNLRQGTGIFENGDVFLREQNLHLRGKSIERLGQLDYRVLAGSFTTCDGDVPAWKFGAGQLDVTLGGFARARHTVFYLDNIPSFYFPYMVFPAKTGRESGLLVPRVGYSERRGFQYSGAYYQVLGQNQDATFYLDYLSDLGLGEGLEYRYIFGRQNAGEARIYHIDVRGAGQRSALKWQHDGQLPGAVRMVADAEYVDNRNYFKDFGEVAGEYNKDKVQSIFFLSRNWEKINLVGLLKYTKDLEIADPTTLQLLPRISFDATRHRIGVTPFYYALSGEYSNFWRDQGLRGQRLTARPSLSASFQLADLIEVTPEVGYRERSYWGLSDGSAAREDGLFDFSTRVSTRLQRIYAQPFGAIDKLRHSIEPEVVYLYTPEDDQSRLPSFDSLDRIDEANRIEYALVQHLTARYRQDDGGASYRDLLYLRLSQSYDLRTDAEQQPFSAIRGELTLLPTDWLDLRSDSTFDIDSGDWSKIAAEVRAHDQQENSLALDYRKDRFAGIEYGTASLASSWLKPVYLSYSKRYDFTSNQQLEQVVGAEYRHQCWSALLTFSEREGDRSLLLTFTMKGIGTVGGLGGSLGGF